MKEANIYIEIPLHFGSLAKIYNTKIQALKRAENTTNQIFEIDKKIFKQYYKIAIDALIPNPINWAFNRINLTYKNIIKNLY